MRKEELCERVHGTYPFPDGVLDREPAPSVQNYRRNFFRVPSPLPLAFIGLDSVRWYVGFFVHLSTLNFLLERLVHGTL